MKSVFLISLFLLSPFFASANVVINEIMYDLGGADKGREWIEIYNGGTEAVDLSGWKFYEGETNHRIKTIGEGNFIVSPGGFAVIADKPENFLIDWPDFSGILFDSSFSLKNSGESLILKDSELNDIDKIDYLSDWGGNGDGNSLQKDGGSWVAAPPTPGTQNSTVPQAEEQEEIQEEEPVAADEEEISEPAAREESAAEGEKEPEIAVEPEIQPVEIQPVEIQPVEIKQEIARTEPLPRKQENKEQSKSEPKKGKAAGYSITDNEKNAFSENNPANAKSVQKREKNIESPPFAVGGTGQTANIITAVSDKVRSIEEWLVLVLILGIFAGIGTLFIRD